MADFLTQKIIEKWKGYDLLSKAEDFDEYIQTHAKNNYEKIVMSYIVTYMSVLSPSTQTYKIVKKRGKSYVELYIALLRFVKRRLRYEKDPEKRKCLNLVLETAYSIYQYLCPRLKRA